MPFKIPPDSERNFEIKYRPLVVGAKETKLVLDQEDLGKIITSIDIIITIY